MSLLDHAPIETNDHVLRARRTAAVTRMAMGAAGVALILVEPRLVPHPTLALLGFVLIQLTAFVHIAAARLAWLSIEESLSATAGVLIIGFGGEQVTVLSILWLVAIASGVLARGGRVHWLGRYIVLGALAFPIARYGYVSSEYAALCGATLGLLLTSGRLTLELNQVLDLARLQAENAETLLLAGDIAARMAERGERAGGEEAASAAAVAAPRLTPEESGSARSALARLIAGDGVAMVVQPIVDVRSGAVHAYEALARFGQPRVDGSPLHWFSLAEEFGERAALGRTCLRLALELFADRPSGTRLTVNLSAPVLLEPLTMSMLMDADERLPGDLEGLIIEITEETLVNSDEQLCGVFAALHERGVRTAVDDMGAGYSGLRQITTVLPSYLKLDRSLVSGINSDGERAALVGALAGYSQQVGSLLVAEGIETKAEMDMLSRLGVPLAQGFYLARPGPPWPSVSARSPGTVEGFTAERARGAGAERVARQPAGGASGA